MIKIDERTELACHKWDGQRMSGYGAFSVSASHVEKVMAYIENQEEHHRKSTFKTEFLGLLRRHKIEFEMEYVVDEEHIA